RTNNVYMGAMAPPDGIAAGGGSVGALGYRHPGTALLALREILGHETYDRALNEYTDRWLYKHPAPFDFFNTFEDVAGQDLDWFWVPWLYGPGISDQAIGGVERNGDEVVITVRNEGTVLSPIKAEITNGDGEKVLAEVPASVWFDGRRETQVRAEVNGPVTRVELDPEGLFADIDPSDDVFEPMQTES
ncbi:MAG: M1 family peptidase, partial [Gemmatimonadota bacterium]